MTPQPGDFFVTRTEHGSLSATLMSALIQWGTDSDVNHAGVCVSPGLVIEARPGGAGYAPLSQYMGSNTQWSTGIIATPVSAPSHIVANAIATIGTPYGWSDCIALALGQSRFGRRVDTTQALEYQPWWVRRLMRFDRLICSQLVDQVYSQCGVHLFTDGRPYGLVSPADLEGLLKMGAVL